MSLRDTLTKRLAERRARRDEARAKKRLWSGRLKHRQERVDNTRERLQGLPKPGAWHPDAKRVPYSDAGPYVTGRPKGVLHTTEGTSLPSYSGSAPHFTFNPRTGDLWQHVAVDRAAKSLEHPSGTVETNRARAVQIELVGFSDEARAKELGRSEMAVVNWGDAEYARIAGLMRWVEASAGVKRWCGVRFVRYPSASYPRLGAQEWLDYNGWCGHQHVPNNHHGDPSLFLIDRVI